MVLENFTKSYLCPDYDESLDVEVIEDEDDLKDIRERKKDNNNPKNNFNMTSTPFGSVPFQTISTPTPKYSWAGSSSNNNNNNTTVNSNNILNTADNTGMGFKPITPNTNVNANQGVEAINRNKRVIVCDFLDCITETLSSSGVPGLIPRDVYDLKPRFEVWNKLAAFNPEKMLILVPTNLLFNAAGVSDSWTITINYYCLALCSYIRIPIESCMSLSYDPFVQKDSVIMGMMGSLGVDKKDVVCVGIYSGINGQSNRDIATANRLGIDYVDLYKLINNMF